MAQSGLSQPSIQGDLSGRYRREADIFHQYQCGREARVFRVKTVWMPLKASWPGPCMLSFRDERI
jgi:hypothetical protein